MRPEARLAAAIGILDAVLAGQAAEQALTRWARASRFAGSGDRAAVRDHVFTALRCLRSHAALGGAMTGRGLMLGALRETGAEPDTLFTGEGHAPAMLSAEERAALNRPVAMTDAEKLDCPDWLEPALMASLGQDFTPVLQALRARAPVFLRVNACRGDRATVAGALAAEGIETAPHPLSATALVVRDGAGRVRHSAAYRDGLVELQDAASQAVTDALPLAPGMRVLDYCAGGGGKALALAAREPRALIACHDIDAGRMADIPARAARAGARIALRPPGDPGEACDLVLCDAPCSGSGSWRRAPEAKWRLDAARLAALQAIQTEILATAAGLVAPRGTLAYATCSLLDAENRAQVTAFLHRRPEWRLSGERRFTPLDGGDGFYLAMLSRE